MRKLMALLAGTAFVCGAAMPAFAATSDGTGELSLVVAALPGFTVPENGPTTVTDAGNGFTIPADAFGPFNAVVPKSLFTGVASISGLTVDSLGNGVINFTKPAAAGPMAGTAIVNVLQFANLDIPLTVVGVAGASVTAALAAIEITVVGQDWVTGPAIVTGITTELPGTTVVNTITVGTGSDVSTAGGGRSVTLVSGFKAITSVAGSLPGSGNITLNFAPEPAAALLSGTAVAALVMLARRKKR